MVSYSTFRRRSVKMRIGNVVKLPRLICITIMVGMVNISFTMGGDRPDNLLVPVRAGVVLTEIADNFSNLGYKPVSDTCPYVEGGGELSDNFLYKEWCEETFDNGDYIYEAYKEIAFNIKYVPELSKVDFWQTPIETVERKKGDCEDAVFLFFSQLHSNQKNAEIVWGWVINKRSAMGRAHVWYQLTDNRGRQYIVEGFSKDWNGIIPMEIVEETESRRPIFTISHSAVSRLSSSLSGANDQQLYQSLIDLLAVANSIDHDSGNQLLLQDANTLSLRSNYEYTAYPANTHPPARLRSGGKSREYTTYRGSYSAGRQTLPDVNKEISNILKKLHELFSRYEKQKEETDMQVAYKGNNTKKSYPERNLMCKR